MTTTVTYTGTGTPRSLPNPSVAPNWLGDRKSTRLNSSHLVISYAVFCLKKKKKTNSSINTKTTQKTLRRFSKNDPPPCSPTQSNTHFTTSCATHFTPASYPTTTVNVKCT